VPLFLRKVTHAKWLLGKPPAWLEPHDIPADLLGDFRTTRNTISLYEIKDDRSNLERVAAALAANSQSLSHFDYLLFDPPLLERVGLSSDVTKGGTPDAKVNEWHSDIVKVSGLKLIELIKLLLVQGELGRIQEKQVVKLIAKSMASDFIDLEKVKLGEGAIQKVNRVLEAEYTKKPSDIVPTQRGRKLQSYFRDFLSRFKR
jgi:hypothetical protein